MMSARALRSSGVISGRGRRQAARHLTAQAGSGPCSWLLRCHPQARRGRQRRSRARRTRLAIEGLPLGRQSHSGQPRQNSSRPGRPQQWRLRRVGLAVVAGHMEPCLVCHHPHERAARSWEAVAGWFVEASRVVGPAHRVLATAAVAVGRQRWRSARQSAPPPRARRRYPR